MAPNVSGVRAESSQEGALKDRIELAGFSMAQEIQRCRSYPMNDVWLDRMPITFPGRWAAPECLVAILLHL